MDVLPRLKLLNAPTALTLPLFSLVMLFTAKGICMNRACSGLEPELLVHFRTWTCKAGNTNNDCRKVWLLTLDAFELMQSEVIIIIIICHELDLARPGLAVSRSSKSSLYIWSIIQHYFCHRVVRSGYNVIWSKCNRWWLNSGCNYWLSCCCLHTVSWWTDGSIVCILIDIICIPVAALSTWETVWLIKDWNCANYSRNSKVS
jgi:hypothetical protein